MVWINDSSHTATNVIITDEPPVDTTYLGGLTCVPAGATVVTSCTFDPNVGPRGTVTVVGDIAPDPGATTQDNASNELVISFDVTLDNPGVEQTIENQAELNWDSDGDGTVDFTVPTDDPAALGATDPTVVQVGALAATGVQINTTVVAGAIIATAAGALTVAAKLSRRGDHS